METRKRMLIALGIWILVYGAFAAFMLFMLGAGMAQTSLRDYDELGIDLLSIFWPLIESILSWMWIALSKKRYAESKYLALGNTIAWVAAVLPPILFYVLAVSGVRDSAAQLLTMVGMPLVGHWTARLLWLKPASATAVLAES